MGCPYPEAAGSCGRVRARRACLLRDTAPGDPHHRVTGYGPAIGGDPEEASMHPMRRRARAAVATGVAAALIAACGSDEAGSGDGGGSGDRLVVWTLENLPDRIAAQQDIAAAFTEASGIDVELVGIDEDQFNPLLNSAAAAGELPDVVGALPLSGVQALAANELIDSDAAASVVDGLGADTFSEQSLRLTRDGDTQLAVPSDGWAQLLLYRKDLFDAAGLAAPDTYDALLAA